MVNVPGVWSEKIFLMMDIGTVVGVSPVGRGERGRHLDDCRSKTPPMWSSVVPHPGFSGTGEKSYLSR